jgi:hypothetical protein
MSIVWCKIPKAGLGNQLFPLLHAAVFAHLNNLPLYITGYHQLKIGPYVRGEKVKRNYAGYFNFQKNIISERIQYLWLKTRYRFLNVVHEPDLKTISNSLKNHVYIFSKLPSSKYYFEKLKPHRTIVKQLLTDLIQPEYLQLLDQIQPPVVGLHIRMGDFRKLNPGEEYNGGHVRMPETYYTEIVNGIREINPNTPVSVFTDGYKKEFEYLFQIADVEMVSGYSDIIDLLLLSKSKVIVGTYGSTFSYWASFLSEGIVITHRFQKHASLRPENMNAEVYEGPFDVTNTLLVESIRKINTISE